MLLAFSGHFRRLLNTPMHQTGPHNNYLAQTVNTEVEKPYGNIFGGATVRVGDLGRELAFSKLYFREKYQALMSSIRIRKRLCKNVPFFPCLTFLASKLFERSQHVL